MNHLTATDALANIAALVALWIYSLVPRFQISDPQLAELLVASPPYIFLFTALVLLKRGDMLWKADLDRAVAAAERLLTRTIEAKDARYDAMMEEHMKAMEQADKERAREREQSQARLDATREHYEARLLERDTLLKENTALLTRAVTLLNGQQKPAA